MSLERLLSLMMHSCPLQCPSIERILATAFGALWLRDHMSAGGSDPRQNSTREELLGMGVPLASAARALGSGKCTRKARGLFTYIKLHRDSTRTKTLQEHHEELKTLAAAFRQLSPAEQHVYRERELDAMNVDDDNLKDWDADYERLAERSLWGLTRRTSAFPVEFLEAEIKAALDLPTEAAIPGMRRYAPKMRDAWAKDAVIKDEGAIPKDTDVRIRVHCPIAHPGLCPEEDTGIFAPALLVSKNLCKYADKLCSKGDVLSVMTRPPAEPHYVMIGCKRQRDPLISYLVPLQGPTHNSVLAMRRKPNRVHSRVI